MYANNPSNVGWGHPKSLLDTSLSQRWASVLVRPYLKAIRQKAIGKKKKNTWCLLWPLIGLCVPAHSCVYASHISHTHTHMHAHLRALWANMHISKQANFRKIFYSVTIKRITDEHDKEEMFCLNMDLIIPSCHMLISLLHWNSNNSQQNHCYVQLS